MKGARELSALSLASPRRRGKNSPLMTVISFLEKELKSRVISLSVKEVEDVAGLDERRLF